MSKKLTTTGLDTFCQLSHDTFSHKANLNIKINNIGRINDIQRNTQYAVNDIVNRSDVPFGWVLQCVIAGRTANNG